VPVTPVDRSGSEPIWSQLQQDLRRRVRQGEFDTAFPPELTLVREYEVSRHTVRQALAQLRSEGVVLAERGRLPRLGLGQGIEQPLGAVYSLFDSVETSGLTQRSTVRRMERTADGIVAARLGLEESTPLLYLERLRFAGDEPLAVDKVWLPLSIAEPLIGVDLSHTALYEELAARASVRITGGREQIHADVACLHQARLLDIAPGDPVFRMDRLGSTDDRPVEWRHTVIRGDRFVLTADFSSGTGYRLGAGTRPGRVPA
jgi:GntR family transcriptional regulator